MTKISFSFQYIFLSEAFGVELLDICTIFSSSDSSAVWTRADCLLQIIEIEKWIIEWWVLTHSGSCHLQVYFQASDHLPYGHFSNTYSKYQIICTNMFISDSTSDKITGALYKHFQKKLQFIESNWFGVIFIFEK